MTEDLLTDVRQQLEDRIEELRDAVEERDRLQANLRALEAEPWVLDAGLAGPMSVDDEPEVPGTAPEAPDAGPTVPHTGQDDAVLKTLDAAPATPDAGQDDAAPEGPDVEPATPVTAEAGSAAMIPGQQTLDVELGMLATDPEPPVNVVPLPVRSEPASESGPEPALAEPEPELTSAPAAPAPEPAPLAPAPESAPAVSPKIARLMSAPRRPALERSGIARVGGRAERADASRRGRVDEDEPPDEIYEQAI
jgi:hypothetical protein